MTGQGLVERGALGSPLHRLVVVAVVTGAAAFFALLWLGERWGIEPTIWSAAAPGERAMLMGLFAPLFCASEVGHVQVRHGDSTEDLTFFEAVLIAGVLVLPPTVAFATAVSGLVAA